MLNRMDMPLGEFAFNAGKTARTVTPLLNDARIAQCINQHAALFGIIGKCH